MSKDEVYAAIEANRAADPDYDEKIDSRNADVIQELIKDFGATPESLIASYKKAGSEEIGKELINNWRKYHGNDYAKRAKTK